MPADSVGFPRARGPAAAGRAERPIPDAVTSTPRRSPGFAASRFALPPESWT